MTEHRLGCGKVLFVNGAIERNAPLCGWPLYALAAKRAGVKRLVGCDEPEIGLSEHPFADGRTVVVAINHANKPVTAPVAIAGRLGRALRGGISGSDLRIAPCDAAVFEVLLEAKR